MDVEHRDGDLRWLVRSEAETEAVGRAIAAVVPVGTVVGLVGPLGAGKTRLVRAIAEALGVDPRAISSPTFVLIHEYPGVRSDVGEFPVFHFDVYRLRSLDEFEALGPWDYFEGGGLCLIEWADRVAASLPADAWRLEIAIVAPEVRGFTLRLPDGSPATVALLDAFAAI